MNYEFSILNSPQNYRLIFSCGTCKCMIFYSETKNNAYACMQKKDIIIANPMYDVIEEMAIMRGNAVPN